MSAFWILWAASIRVEERVFGFESLSCAVELQKPKGSGASTFPHWSANRRKGLVLLPASSSAFRQPSARLLQTLRRLVPCVIVIFNSPGRIGGDVALRTLRSCLLYTWCAGPLERSGAPIPFCLLLTIRGWGPYACRACGPCFPSFLRHFFPCLLLCFCLPSARALYLTNISGPEFLASPILWPFFQTWLTLRVRKRRWCATRLLDCGRGEWRTLAPSWWNCVVDAQSTCNWGCTHIYNCSSELCHIFGCQNPSRMIQHFTCSRSHSAIFTNIVCSRVRNRVSKNFWFRLESCFRDWNRMLTNLVKQLRERNASCFRPAKAKSGALLVASPKTSGIIFYMALLFRVPHWFLLWPKMCSLEARSNLSKTLVRQKAI